jgi:small subunit ribosomal protein S8
MYMNTTDPVADLLTRIRNASKARRNAVDIPASNLKREIIRILQESKYLKDMVELPDSKQGMLRVYLQYAKGDIPVIKGIERVSRPGLRKYFDATEVRLSTHNSRGIMVVSTSRGILTNHDAAKMGVGGEVMLKCW